MSGIAGRLDDFLVGSWAVSLPPRDELVVGPEEEVWERAGGVVWFLDWEGQRSVCLMEGSRNGKAGRGYLFRLVTYLCLPLKSHFYSMAPLANEWKECSSRSCSTLVSTALLVRLTGLSGLL